MITRCLTCIHARKVKGTCAGFVYCDVHGVEFSVGSTCLAAVPLVFRVPVLGGVEVAVSSTTATNSPSGTIQGQIE